MIKVSIKKDEIIIKGHAGYEEVGKDIVCASVSSIVITSVNSILRIDNTAITYEENGGILIKILKHNEIVDKLIDNLIDLLKDLEKQYPKYIETRRC